MRSHRTIWIIAGAAACLALVAFALREIRGTSDRVAAVRLAHEARDHVVAEMMHLLQTDPRVRRPGTQRAVEQLAEYSLHPTLANAEAYYALGLKRYYRDSDFEGAESAYFKALELEPGWSWPHNGLGILWFTTGQEDRAMAAFEEAMRLDPDWSRPHSDMAILYRREKRMDEAVREVEAALKIEPRSPINHFNYGVILDDLGRHQAARGRYRRALELSPGLPPAIYNIACSYAREGNLETAVPYLIESIALDEAFREEARRDVDFDAVRDRPEFIKIVEGTAN